MKKYIVTIGFSLLFLIGLSVLLYPAVSSYVNSVNQSYAISRYNKDLVKLNETDYSGIIEAANAYNQRLVNRPDRFKMTESERKEYHSILDFTGTGLIGTLEIPEIKVNLPIYLGTEENILQAGLGHFEGSSLPVGGLGTHAVISGHRGLPSSTLLTNADQLIIGDTFTLKILNETLTYQIDNIVIVEPNDLKDLAIDPNKDYCTLTTCTPYGINSHRLLLRGVRIFPEEQKSGAQTLIISADARSAGYITQYSIAAAPVLLISMIFAFVKNKVKNKKRKEVLTGL